MMSPIIICLSVSTTKLLISVSTYHLPHPAHSECLAGRSSMGNWKPTKVWEDQTLGTNVLTPLADHSNWDRGQHAEGATCWYSSVEDGLALSARHCLQARHRLALSSPHTHWPLHPGMSSRRPGVMSFPVVRDVKHARPDFPIPVPQDFTTTALQFSVCSEETPHPQTVGRWVTGRPGSTFSHRTSVREDCTLSPTTMSAFFSLCMCSHWSLGCPSPISV